MAYSLSFLMSADAAVARAKRTKDHGYVVHLEVAPYTDAPMTELDATDVHHARAIARDWLVNGRCHSVGIRQRSKSGCLVDGVEILDASDFEDDLAEITQRNLNRTMSQYGLIG